MKLLVELAEALQAPVIDQKGRMNFPNTHHLSQNARGRALIGQADVILGLELSDYWGTVNGFIDNGENDGAGLQESRIKPERQADQHQLGRCSTPSRTTRTSSASRWSTSKWRPTPRRPCRR